MKTYNIKEEQVKNLISFLQKLPYEQVYQGINMLMTLEEIEAKDDDGKK